MYPRCCITSVIFLPLMLSNYPLYESVRRVCDSLDSVSWQQRLKWWTSVTLWLQFRVLFSKKKSIPKMRRWLIPTERPQPVLAPSFYRFCLLSPEPALYKLGLIRKGAFISPEVLTLVWGFFPLFPFCRLSLSFNHHHFGLLSLF